MVDAFLAAHDTAPEEIVLDMDATDDPIHGEQEGRFFHGYYRRYCYLPLYIFWANISPVCADPISMVPMERWMRIIRSVTAGRKCLIIRADSGFCRELRWSHQDYVRVGQERPSQARDCGRTHLTGRGCLRISSTALKSWSCTRRVVAKADLDKGANGGDLITDKTPRRPSSL